MHGRPSWTSTTSLREWPSLLQWPFLPPPSLFTSRVCAPPPEHTLETTPWNARLLTVDLAAIFLHFPLDRGVVLHAFAVVSR